jgi:predicted naringenin-chalcone synthase
MTVNLSSIETAVPDTCVLSHESLHIANALCGPYMSDAGWLPAVYENCGVKQRYQVLGQAIVNDLLQDTRISQSPFLPGKIGGPTTEQRMAIYAKEAGPLALQAAGKTLQAAKWTGDRITHLVTVSCTGFQAPGIDVLLMRELGMSPGVERTHVGFMGCHGALNGLRVAKAFCEADPSAVVLLVAVELCSLHYYYGAEPSKVIANALFADGAAAMLVSQEIPGVPVTATGSQLLANSEREMAWVIGDHGFGMTMTKQIPRLIEQHLRAWVEGWLLRRGLGLGDIARWAVHPGGPKILEAVQSALDLPQAALVDSWQTLANYGNMSSPTVFFILKHQSQRPLPGPTMVLGFGPGLIVEAAMLGPSSGG